LAYVAAITAWYVDLIRKLKTMKPVAHQAAFIKLTIISRLTFAWCATGVMVSSVFIQQEL